MRVLDEVADAVRIARGGYAHPVTSSIVLEELFGGSPTPRQWAAMQKHLGCPLVEFDQGHWFPLRDDFLTVWELVAYVAEYRPDWEPPREPTTAAWRNAQIFAGVRAVLVDAGNLDPEQVVREARFVRDLNLV
jgi:hypothetical protein